MLIDGICGKVDVNQWGAKTLIKVADISQYTVLNKGRKSKVYYVKDGVRSEENIETCGENIISVSGIGSELTITNI